METTNALMQYARMSPQEFAEFIRLAVTTDAGLTCHDEIPTIDRGSELDDLDQAAEACTSRVAALPSAARQRGLKQTVSRASDKNLAAIQDDLASNMEPFDIGGDPW